MQWGGTVVIVAIHLVMSESETSLGLDSLRVDRCSRGFGMLSLSCKITGGLAEEVLRGKVELGRWHWWNEGKT